MHSPAIPDVSLLTVTLQTELLFPMISGELLITNSESTADCCQQCVRVSAVSVTAVSRI